jgi:competence protein CoiA
MLIAIRASDKASVRASTVTGTNSQFVCPYCFKEVVPCQSGAVTRHFIHRGSLPCSYDAGESEAHRRVKNEIYEALLRHPDASRVQLELPLPTVRPDVFAHIRGVPVAIEVQISTLSPETITRRTEEYTRLGIYVLWLLQWTPELNTDRYSPRRFERWLHATYFGRVYFWKQGLHVLPYHFHEHHSQVDERRWRDERGHSRTSRSYRRVSKRYKMPVCGRTLHLVHDFRKTTRLPWSGGTLNIPKANLFMDESRNFIPE